MYPRFHMQLERNRATYPSLRDEARFPCIAAEQCLAPNQSGKDLYLLDRTKENPPEVPNKSRRTLMSLQEFAIARCRPNQLEMTSIPPALASEPCPIPDHTGRLAWLLLANSRVSHRHPTQVYRNTNFSLGTRGKLHALHIVSRRADSQDSIKEVGHIPTTPQEEPSRSNQYVRRTLNLLHHVQCIPRFPELKESRISFQWLECRLVFLLTI